jgi:hypothetical protein
VTVVPSSSYFAIFQFQGAYKRGFYIADGSTLKSSCASALRVQKWGPSSCRRKALCLGKKDCQGLALVSIAGFLIFLKGITAKKSGIGRFILTLASSLQSWRAPTKQKNQ